MLSSSLGRRSTEDVEGGRVASEQSSTCLVENMRPRRRQGRLAVLGCHVRYYYCIEAGVSTMSLPRLRSLFSFRHGVTESLYQISRTSLLVTPSILTKTLRRQGMLEASPRPVKPQKARRPRDADSMNLLRARTPKPYRVSAKLPTRPARIGRCRRLLAGRSAATPAFASLIGRASCAGG
jgi:hypothetical protein